MIFSTESTPRFAIKRSKRGSVPIPARCCKDGESWARICLILGGISRGSHGRSFRRRGLLFLGEGSLGSGEGIEGGMTGGGGGGGGGGIAGGETFLGCGPPGVLYLCSSDISTYDTSK